LTRSTRQSRQPSASSICPLRMLRLA
jgi:hypothetical protein